MVYILHILKMYLHKSLEPLQEAPLYFRGL